MTDLKCPFCESSELHVPTSYNTRGTTATYRVVCKKCGMQGPPASSVEDAKAFFQQCNKKKSVMKDSNLPDDDDHLLLE